MLPVDYPVDLQNHAWSVVNESAPKRCGLH